jgi:hypothetical protein
LTPAARTRVANGLAAQIAPSKLMACWAEERQFPLSPAWGRADVYSNYIPTAIVTAIFGSTEEVLKL